MIRLALLLSLAAGCAGTTLPPTLGNALAQCAAGFFNGLKLSDPAAPSHAKGQ